MISRIFQSVSSHTQNCTNSEKKGYLLKLSASIVDKNIVDEAKLDAAEMCELIGLFILDSWNI